MHDTEPVDAPALQISLSSLQNGWLRNGIQFGDDPGIVKEKETLPLSNQGTEKGNPWLIFMGAVAGNETQIIYNFDKTPGVLDEISCQFGPQTKSSTDHWYSTYYNFLFRQFGEPVDSQKLKIKMAVHTRAMVNASSMMNLMVKLTGNALAMTHFDTWVIELEKTDVKIDLIVLETNSGTIEDHNLYLSYKFVPKGILS